MSKRTEKDSMGEMEVPAEALYGASTQRAVLNFPVSGVGMPLPFIKALALLKKACAETNMELGKLDEGVGQLIAQAADEIVDGKHDGQFPVDIFQTGSGTSSNMNVNEVIANRCSQLAGKEIGSKEPAHPNDHVNLGQSSNDVVPSALHVGVAMELKENLIPALSELEKELAAKAETWGKIIKIGRTHFMDAVPLSLGQEFSGYARQVGKGALRAGKAIHALRELPIGGTAVGTGLNAPEGFGAEVCRRVSERTGIEFEEASNHFEAQGGRDDAVEVAGQLVAVAASLAKIASDIRMLGSGPRSGLGEISLPAVQPGSSIMPGKVNPVMCETVIQTSHYVMGLCQTVSRCGQDGQFELNVTMPLMAHCLHQSISCLANASRLFAQKCVKGLEANEERCSELVEQSLMLVTALNPKIGYDKAAEVAKKAFKESKTLKEVLTEEGIMSREEADEALDASKMIG